MKRALCAFGFAAVFLGVGPASGQNLLQNGTFDGGIVPWSLGSFSTLDALGSGTSGSIQYTNSSTTPFNVTSLLSECVAVTSGKSYERRYDYRITASAGVDGLAQVFPAWYSGTTCGSFLGFGSVPQDGPADGAWHRSTPFTPLTAPSGAQSVRLFLGIIKTQATGSVTANFDNVVFKAAGTCAPLPDIICLNNGRFQVEADWTTSTDTGRARAVKLTSDSGYLWFFGSDNIEVVVKLLDACSFSGNYWVFAGGLTDQGVQMTVTDTKTGTVKTYRNTRGTPFAPLQDTSAFATCP